MALPARGVATYLTVAQETVPGQQATVDIGLALRRGMADFNVNVVPIESSEIVQSQQVSDARHGPQSVSGTISGQLYPGSYYPLIANILRNTFPGTGAASVTLSDAAFAVNSTTGIGTLSTSSGNFVTAGFKVGDVVQMASLTGGAAGDDLQNTRILTMPANNNMTLAPFPNSAGEAPFSASTQTLLLKTKGSKCFPLPTLATQGTLSIEKWFSDLGVSEVYVGCVVTSLGINIPPTGFASLQASIIGTRRFTYSSRQYASPNPIIETGALTAVNGAVIYNGVPIAIATSASIQLSLAAQNDPVIGSNYAPFIQTGTFRVSGSFNCFMMADTMENDFIQENEFDLSFLMTDSAVPYAQFVQLYLPRVKLMSAQKNDSDRAIMRSYQFVGLQNVGSVPNADMTTIVWQDSSLGS